MQKVEKKQMVDFVHLHTHSTYSLFDGYGLPEQVFDRIEEIGHKSVGITDHGNIWGIIPFMTRAKERNINVIPGCEFYIVDDATMKTNSIRYHITVLAKNDQGLKNLNRLITFSNLKGFYYKPRIDFEKLLECNEGLIVLSGCMGAGVLINHLDDSAYVENYLTTFSSKFGDDFYIEVSPIEKYSGQIERIISIANGYNIQLCSTNDSHFPKPSDHKAQDVMLCVHLKTTYGDPQRMQIMPELYLYDGEEAEKRGQIYGEMMDEAFQNTLEIEDKCCAELPKAQSKLFPLPDEENETAYMRKLIEKGIVTRKLDSMPNWDVYESRIEKEWELISKKGFADYFLIIWDLVDWAKQRMLVGPGRGSVAGCLISYILGITEVDPIAHGLMFERFLDETRIDPPDIDLDFPHNRRDEVVNYLKKKYGDESTSLLGTLSVFKPKISIWDTRRVFDLSWTDAKELAQLSLQRTGADSRASFCLKDTFKEFGRAKHIINASPEFAEAAKLEGQIRQTGVHAAAVVISDKPLENLSGFVLGKENEQILSVDKYGAQDLELLKIDILGLKQLGIFENVLSLIGKDNDWLYNLPLDDEDSYQVLEDRRYAGIFQFEGEAVRIVSRRVHPDEFRLVSDISALARPGPLHCGGTTRYLNRRAYDEDYDVEVKEKPHYHHPILKRLASDTYGIVIYQEQVLQILKELGNMSWDDAAKLRRSMSKSYGVEFFNRYKEKFLKGAKENGLNEEVSNEIWDNICTFGSWAYNRSHCISYALISYWCCYLKAHYPSEFYLSVLMNESDESKIRKLLREWVDRGGEYVSLDIEKSRLNFTLDGNVICGGFSNVKGIGEKTAGKLIQSRPWIDSEQFRKVVGQKIIGILKRLEVLPKLQKIQLDLFGESGIDNYDDVPMSELSKNELLPWAELFPIGNKFNGMIRKHNLDITKIDDITDHTNQVKIIAKIKNLDLRSKEETYATAKRSGWQDKDKKGKFLDLLVEDDTESIFCNINTKNYETMGRPLFDHGAGSIVGVSGYKIKGYHYISVRKIQVLESANGLPIKSWE